MTFARITNAQRWTQALSTLPARHVLQSWEWGQFKSRWGWRPTYLLFEEHGQPLAAALVLQRRLTRFGPSILYVPKGPALNYSEATLTDEVLAALAAWARETRAIFIKIDPDLAATDRSILCDHGWQPSNEQIQFRNTMLLDLRPSEDELLAAMKPKTRYNIRLAEKKGVGVREGSLADLELLYRLYVETSQRDRFLIRPFDYYRDAWGSFIQSGLAQPLIAEVDHEAVAGLILFHFADRAWYMYGMSRSLHRERMPNYLLQWRAIQWARSRGCQVYDLWGAPDQLSEDDALWGVYRFKEGLGGKFVEQVGAYDFVVSRLGYWLYSVAMPKVLQAMRRRHHFGS
jgi:peptidoglycan pentaglycine glycine transferase (the first glycine)